MGVVRLCDRGDVGELVCEFLEVCIHQLLCVRELYPQEIFERRRYINTPVQWARHPDLREYIHSAVTNLQPWVQQGVVDKVTLLVMNKNRTLEEKFVFSFGLKQLSTAGVPAQHLEFALRGFLLKISVSDSFLSPLPPDCSWELVTYLKSSSLDTINKDQPWVPADDEGWDQNFIMTSMKSMRSSYLDMQLYVEHSVEKPTDE
ncbi:DNA polymerase zeta processivity subunit-like isoform X2 [Physcomitrium patens]|uniref:HORMA domain-containing protein n=1 Tax=Physcomitrium patens TaxID=3218 RepID=A9SZS0_PHYPA|nr:DNA polymerase zeta processivity subunit-like isoform X2 [Physcomitrium patens]|eukprot:XP_024372420.1 DNA polymerase zeta processivity subunit-like isoform X2 [Physcomitrella patens]